MTIIVSTCGCHDWDQIGARVDEIPDCKFGGIHWFKNARDAMAKWFELDSQPPPAWSSGFRDPYYWAVHLNGAHVLNVLVDNLSEVVVRSTLHDPCKDARTP